MEIISRPHHHQYQHQDNTNNNKDNPSPANSPSSHGSSSTTGAVPTPPLTPRPVSRSDPNPYPTTFVQADTTSFKQVVQMLTGSSNPSPNPTHQQPDPVQSKTSIPPVKTGQQKKFKLYERRNSLKNGLMINPGGHRFGGHSHSPRVAELLSPSILDFPALVLSPVTPLSIESSSEEERVIKEKGFYLHPSPRAATPRGTPEPQLLPLFPVTSPRVSNSST